ncbi:WD40 repeat-like protein [Tuber magnatum]|uniref:Ribosome biogenesis protein YTM1 n=1 Tax=Tuber magnatum TaxID=42249 RepID=A0A317SFZ6_9PEZI|nr:WD40 repeat-like protein [Tuber magnatum]
MTSTENTPMDGTDTQSTHQVQVKFTTRHPDIAVPTAPILVPANLKRYGLSQIINHLLDTSTAIPFEFLVNGSFLRTSIERYLSDNGLSSESVLTLEYVRAIIPPKFQAAFQHDDWVSSVSVERESKRILSGSYDGIVRVWNESAQCLYTGVGHTDVVKTAKWMSATKSVSAGMDRGLRIWEVDGESIGEENSEIFALAELVGHRGTVEKISVDSSSGRVLSAGMDSLVGFWTTNISEASKTPKEAPVPRAKRRKETSTGPPRYGPLRMLEGHTSPVSAVVFDPKDSTVGYSISWDHTIRTWDLATYSLVDTRTTQHPLLSVCVLPKLSLLACGSAARHITLHDPRVSASTVTTSTLRGHTNAVVALSPNKSSEWQMVSASHDGTLRIWDVRATESGSIWTIKREGEGLSGKEKVFDVEWSSLGIVSGGEDKRVQIDDSPKGE